MKIQYNIMMFDIDKKNNNFRVMNILQLKWMLLNLIQKNNYNKILKTINNLIMQIFIYL